jgi:hypothetical protein
MLFNLSREGDRIETIGMMAAYLIVLLIIVLVVSQIIYRRNKIADKIVGIEETASPQSQVEWIGFSYRLISIIAGLYCFYRATNAASMMLLNSIMIMKSKSPNSGTMLDKQIYGNALILVILLAAGTYLLCGASHFVRWQVKKTKEMFVKCG